MHKGDIYMYGSPISAQHSIVSIWSPQQELQIYWKSVLEVHMVPNVRIMMRRIRVLVICLSIVLAFSLLYSMYTLTLNDEKDAQGRLARRLNLFEIAQSMRSTDSTHVIGSNGKLYTALANESENMFPHEPVTGKVTQQSDRGNTTHSYNLVKQDTIHQVWGPKLDEMITPEQKSPTLATTHGSSAMATTHESPLSATQHVGIDQTDRVFVSQVKEAENKVDNQIADGHRSLQELAKRDRASRIVMIPKSPLTQVQLGTAMQSQQLQEDTVGTHVHHGEDSPNTYDKDHMTSVHHTSAAKGGSKPIPEMSPKTAILNKQAPTKTAVLNKQAPAKTAILNKQAPGKTAILNKQAPAKSAILNKQAPGKSAILNKQAPAKSAILNKQAPGKSANKQAPGKTAQPPAISNNRQRIPPAKTAKNRRQTNANSHPSMISNPMAPSSPSYDINATPPPIPYMGNYHCQSSICRELLYKEDMPYYNYCIKKVNLRHKDEISEPQCHYMNGTHRAAVALASLPGSGNTWLRGLLEQATGICTGAIYCDVTLKMAGFAGEGLRSGAVLAVKTHRTWGSWTEYNHPIMVDSISPKYGSAILLIRNPFDALVAEWNRVQGQKLKDPSQNGSHHVKYVGREYFGENKAWKYFVGVKIMKWQSYFTGWVLGNLGHPLLVVRFEDLKKDAPTEIKRILDFLKVPYSDDEVEKRLMEGFGGFQRKHHDEYDHFTPEQRQLVLSVVEQTVHLLSNGNHHDSFGLQEYLTM